LGSADLRGADLRDADLRGADLGGADLRDANNYSHNHDFWIEIIRRQALETFTEEEWSMIGQIYVHRFCWKSIKKRYNKKVMPIFEKLVKCGFDEWEKIYKEKLSNPQ
jgi:hypothetical protein